MIRSLRWMSDWFSQQASAAGATQPRSRWFLITITLGRAGYLQAMTRTERLTERAISFAIAEADDDMAVARLAFLAQGDHAALDAALDACLARTERTLYTPLAGHRLPGQGPLRGPANPAEPAAPSSARSSSGKGSGPGKLPRPELRQPTD
jgi:hypothetical protein